MVMIPDSSVWSLRGWRSSLLPVPPSASLGSRPYVEVAHGSGVVPLPTSGGDGGGGDDRAAATTTMPSDAVTTFIGLAFTTPPMTVPLPHDASDIPLVRAGILPALLPMMLDISRTFSISGRGHASEGLQRARQLVGHPPPPPAVVVDRAARHGGDRPAVFANTALATVPPRPGSPGLLPPSLQPQRGRIRQRGGRAGSIPRAARMTGADAADAIASHPVAVAFAMSPVAM